MIKAPRFDLLSLPKSRRTVVDLLTIIGTSATPAHILKDIDMTRANKLKEELGKKGQRITITAILLKAIAVVQASYPQSRTEMLPWGRLVTYNDVVAGFTIERFIDGQPTVYFGEISAPQNRELSEIGAILQAHASGAIENIEGLVSQEFFTKLPMAIRKLVLELSKRFPVIRLKFNSATFGLTTLGKFGIDSLLSPCLCTSTFGIGTIEDRPIVINKEIVIRPMMTISLNFNQNAMDMPTAARFLNDVSNLLENDIDSLISGKKRKIYCDRASAKTDNEVSDKSISPEIHTPDVHTPDVHTPENHSSAITSTVQTIR